MAKNNDPLKEKFRPDDAALDKEVEDALAGVSLDDLYGFDKPAPQQAPGASQQQRNTRRGRIVSIDKDDAFIDFGGKSQGIISLQQFPDEEPPVVGQEMEFNVDRYDEREGVLVLTRKGATAQNASWENLEVGQIVEGTVTGVNKGGLELEVKKMRAFMPAGQVDLYFNPDLAVFLNQKMTAEVTQFDAHAKNLILSRRNVLEREKEDSKKKLLEELAEGQVRRGTVRNVTDFGAFVDLGGADGLLHVSEMSFKRGVKPADLVKVGDSLDVKILKFDRESGKMSLSLKQARGIDPWMDAASKYGVGTQITGRVTKVESFGAFIEVEEGLEGLLPVSEMSWQRIKSPSDVVKEGDTLRLVVLSVDPAAKRMSFSLKQAGTDPWKTAGERYATDMVVSGAVTRLVDFGAFVELEPGLEGLVHVSELSDQRVRSPGDVVKQGQQVNVRVLELDADGRRISLSLKSVHVLPATTAGVTAGAIPAAATKKKKPVQLRGGLDF
ncbi:MAG: S1 RNA-binding domain-containing protein [Verrucomicrobiota bacterium]|nr:S1 RNA-binding domain-containing protein [Verrucomicrobiota bacterium]